MRDECKMLNVENCVNQKPDLSKVPFWYLLKVCMFADNEFIKEEEPYSKQIKITLCVILANLMIGYTVGWSAPISVKLNDPEQSPLSYSISEKEISWTVTAWIIGALVVANASGYIGNVIGRKNSMLLFSFINLIGYVLTAQASSYAVMILGRTINGGGSALSVLNLVYIGEVASPNIRGSLLTMTGIFHVIGSLIVYSIGPYISYEGVCYVSMAINCVHLLALLYIPESPVYLLMKGKEDEAKTTLIYLGRSKDIDKVLRPMMADIEESKLPETNENKSIITQAIWKQVNVDEAYLANGKQNEVKMRQISRWKQLIFEKKNRKAFMITTVLFCLQNGGGVMAILFFATTIFKNAQSSVDPSVGTIILGFTELFGVALSSVLVEKCGRRIMLLLSTGCCSLSMGILGTYFYIESTQEIWIASIRWLPLVLLTICLFTFNFGWLVLFVTFFVSVFLPDYGEAKRRVMILTGLGIVPNTLTGEMYSPVLRTTATSVSMTLAWTMAMATSSSFGYIAASLGNYGVFWLYSFINAMGFVFTMFVVPETKGKTLTEIGYMLES